MNLNTALRISSSGLAAERTRLDIISGNIANANSVSTKDGKEAYRRHNVELIAGPEGVQIGKIQVDGGVLPTEQDPTNPNAVNGIVTHSNVNPITEMVDMLGASRAYEANVAAFNSAKGMIRSALTIGKV